MTAATRRVVAGHDAASALRSLCGDERTLVVYDGRVPGASATEAGVRTVGASIDVSLGPPDPPALADELRRGSPTTVVAIGGGSTLDATKLALLGYSDPALLAHVVRARAHRALVLLPPSPPRRLRLIAVPTTVGTSSEVNAVAVTTAPQGHRLVIGESLRPAVAVHAGELLASLPDAAVREGCLEALLRVAGVATGAEHVPDVAIRLAGDLVRAGNAPMREPHDRLRVARLAAATQDPALRAGGVFAPKHWYVANEVSFALGVRKMPATAAVVPAVWRRIDDGDRRWGDRAGLRTLWGGVARAADLPGDPADGILALSRRWGVARPGRPSVGDVLGIARAVEHAWGATRPALRGIRAADVAAILEDGAWDARAPARAGSRPAPASRGGGDNT